MNILEQRQSEQRAFGESLRTLAKRGKRSRRQAANLAKSFQLDWNKVKPERAEEAVELERRLCQQIDMVRGRGYSRERATRIVLNINTLEIQRVMNL